MSDLNTKLLITYSNYEKLNALKNVLEDIQCNITCAQSGAEALAQIALNRPDLIISDLDLTDMSGMVLFDNIHQADASLPMIIYASQGKISDAVAAIQAGIIDFLIDSDDQSKLLRIVKSVIDSNYSPHISAEKEKSWREGIFTRSQLMEDLINQARQVAITDVSVLIRGDSGTGKELLAQAIHQVSPRKNGPFVAINCGAMPEALLESELFGHVKGAFTGAISDHKGLFQSAEGGTILLDEIGDMPLLLQVKLLRVLQERVVRPVGASKNIPINVRVISATHRNLTEEMQEKRFREDLYYRINVVNLGIPTLAERREDIALIANNLLQALCKRHNKKINGFAPEAMRMLISAKWPGNVRQLQNVVEQMVVLSTTSIVPLNLVQKALQDNIGTIIPFEISRKNFERNYLINLLKMTNGNVAQAASIAQRHRTEFYKLLERHELTPAMFKDNQLA